jgi:hypothetical protein
VLCAGQRRRDERHEPMRLIHAQTFESGVAFLTYEAVREA